MGSLQIDMPIQVHQLSTLGRHCQGEWMAAQPGTLGICIPPPDMLLPNILAAAKSHERWDDQIALIMWFINLQHNAKNFQLEIGSEFNGGLNSGRCVQNCNLKVAHGPHIQEHLRHSHLYNKMMRMSSCGARDLCSLDPSYW